MASGKNKGLTQTYYDTHPDANKRRLAQQKQYDANNPEATKRRVAANKGNRAAGTYGNGDGKDFSHTSKKTGHLESASKNRARPRTGKKYAKKRNSDLKIA